MRDIFPRLLGNENTKLRLGRAIEDGTLSHAFLIGGPSGSGKSLLAMEIAAAVNCEAKGTEGPLPCGRCASCHRVYSGGFTDVRVLSKPSDKATLGVDPIKEIREDMFLSATESDYKVYIIDDAECMTPEAQNALLKVLEEPPSGVIIMLLARECDKILTTIKSRTQYIAMSRFDEAELAKYLPARSEGAARLKIEDEERFRGILMSAGGRLGEAIRLCDARRAEENESERSETLRFISALKKNTSYADIYSAVMALSSSKRGEVLFSLERIISAMRDLVAISRAEDARLIFYTERGECAAVAKAIGLRRLLRAYDAVIEAHSFCTRNANIGNLLHGLAAKIAMPDRQNSKGK